MTHALFGLESDNCAECSREYADSAAQAQRQFAHFYERFQPRLLRYARRVWGPRDAEEITQETLVRAYEAIDLGRDERSLWGWLVVVGRNVAADLARARRMCDVGGEAGTHDATVDPKCVEQSVLDSECLSTLEMALSALPPSQSRAWWLSVAEGMTPSTIAESLSCSPESVRQALFKSRKRLAAAMADFCDRTAAFAVPAVLFFRRGSGRVSRGVAPAAANGFLSAAIISTSAFTATVFAGGTAVAPAAAPMH
ncbi:MAG: sigma-70 family RNA polymerase sigma factor, partial [Frankiaceae bacterium]|nr:sigma-70 family RNA polymerase sigma factor [Frankiaceae bacterium]